MSKTGFFVFGDCLMMFFTQYDSPCGKILLASDENTICGIWFEQQKHYACKIDEAILKKDDLPVFIKTKQWLDAYFAAKNPDTKIIPLSLKGSKFQQLVWQILQTIEYGKTMSYGQIAKIIENKTGKRMSAQAVGRAVGKNPISIIVPCHRVLGTGGKLTGYAGGIATKIRLLKIENIAYKEK